MKAASCLWAGSVGGPKWLYTARNNTKQLQTAQNRSKFGENKRRSKEEKSQISLRNSEYFGRYPVKAVEGLGEEGF